MELLISIDISYNAFCVVGIISDFSVIFFYTCTVSLPVKVDSFSYMIMGNVNFQSKTSIPLYLPLDVENFSALHVNSVNFLCFVGRMIHEMSELETVTVLIRS